MKLLLVEDSRSVITFIERMLRDQPDIELLSPVSDGREGVAAVQRHHPQLVLMDLELPGLDGVEAIQEIMATAPCPIVVLSARLDLPGRDRTFESLQAGAVDVLAKPAGLDPESVRDFRERLLRTIRVMSQARVVKRRRQSGGVAVVQPAEAEEKRPSTVPCSLVVIGGSTGAPPVVYALLRALPAPAPFPVVVLQHIVNGFEHGFARWLAGTGHSTQVVAGGEWLEPGRVFVSPANQDLGLLYTRLAVLPPQGPATPSVDVFFQKVAESPLAGSTLALLLTGMGEDGARGMMALRKAGGHTVTQDPASCVVDSMPSRARALGASCQTLTPQEMAALLGQLARGVALPRVGPG